MAQPGDRPQIVAYRGMQLMPAIRREIDQCDICHIDRVPLSQTGFFPCAAHLDKLEALYQQTRAAPIGVGERAFQEHVISPDEAEWLRGIMANPTPPSE